jgi:hypothetical protein
LLCDHPDDKEQISEFVGYLKLQVLPGLKFAINITEKISDYHGCFHPRGIYGRNFFAFEICGHVGKWAPEIMFQEPANHGGKASRAK